VRDGEPGAVLIGRVHTGQGSIGHAGCSILRSVSVPDHVNESMEALADLHGRAERDVTVHQRGIESVTAALGRPRFLYVAIGLVMAWVGVNLVLPLLGHAAFDPAPFHYLHLILTLSALLMATVVLVTQNRQIRLADKRSHLDLQINLLAESKIAKVIALLEELRRDLPNVHNRTDAEASDMSLRTDPQVVLQKLEESLDADLEANEGHDDAGHGAPTGETLSR